MRHNIIFETKQGNKYLYAEGMQSSILLPPELVYQVKRENNSQTGSYLVSKIDDYYKQKYNFLLSHHALESAEISFITKPDPEQVKIKLANLRQLLLEVTDGCNLKCHYCGYGEMYTNYDPRHSRILTFGKVKKVIDYMENLWNSPYNHSYNNVVDISFYGGEPLLNMDLIQKTIDYVENKKVSQLQFTYRMTTNGMLLDRYMDFLAEKNFNLLISLDGDEYGNSYRETKGGNNSFQQVYRNVLALKEKYPDYYEKQVNFNAVLHDRNTYEGIYLFIKHNLNKIPLVSELNDNGIREDKREEFRKMFKSTYDEQKKAYENCEEISGNDLFTKAENVQFRSMLHGHTGNTYKSLNDLLKTKNEIFHMPSGTCMAFYKKFFLTVNGKVLPCEKIGQQYPLGWVDEEKVDIDFQKISSLYENMYRPLLKLCKQCYHQLNCAQCVFNIFEKSKGGKLYCPTFVNKNSMAGYLSTNVSYIEENPEVYEEMINKEVLS